MDSVNYSPIGKQPVHRVQGRTRVAEGMVQGECTCNQPLLVRTNCTPLQHTEAVQPFSSGSISPEEDMDCNAVGAVEQHTQEVQGARTILEKAHTDQVMSNKRNCSEEKQR